MLLSFCCVPSKSYHQIIRSLSSYPQTHYDVLKLKRNCTAQEIREAFIKLSKEYHPDAKGAKTNHKDTVNFVKISEAYQVLSKTVTRDAYDQDLLAKGITGSAAATSAGLKKPEVHRPWEIKPDYDTNPGPYYGIKGIKRMSNGKIVMVLVVFAVLSVGMGFLSAKHSFTFNRAQLDVKSKEAGEHHAAVRADAHKFGNDEQLKRVVDRFLTRPS